jgi:AcrR family transcriptional regulator
VSEKLPEGQKRAGRAGSNGGFMGEKKQDHRVRFTKLVIRDSFIALLKAKPLSKVTVKEICEGAGINRATFYAHYADPFDLLHQIEEEFVEEVTLYIGNGAGGELTGDISPDAVRKILEYVQNNAEICDILLNSDGDLRFLQEITAVIGRQFVASWTASKPVKKAEAEYIFQYSASGSVGMIQKWLEGGMKHTPEELAGLMLRMTQRGYSDFF